MLYRTRTHPTIVRYGLYLYYSSRSFRLALDHYHQSRVREEVMYLFGNRWVQKYADCAADRFRTDKKRRVKEILFVDETLLQIDGYDYWLWIAYEPNLGICLMMYNLSRERTIFFVCYQFFKQLRNRFGGRKPI
jgi:transposase-like protein